jgi:hypothetical protein
MSTAHRAILFLIWFSVAVNAKAQAVPDLKSVMKRAQNYVDTYEERLGTLIGQETYRQTAKWDGRGRQGGTLRRTMSSDFLLIRVEGQWFGVRNVLTVDQRHVGARLTDFSRILRQSPVSAAQQLAEITTENGRYNIGDFIRTFNVPTFPLKILHSSNIGGFAFEKGAMRKNGNTTTWEIRFSETAHPTLIHDLKGNDQPQHGTLWIDPDTGTVLKTETGITMRVGLFSAKVTLLVTYNQSLNVNMLVPATMEEHYDSAVHRVEATATYSDFRRFGTEVKLLDIGPIER